MKESIGPWIVLVFAVFGMVLWTAAHIWLYFL